MTRKQRRQLIENHIIRNKARYTAGVDLTRSQFIRLTRKVCPDLVGTSPYDSRDNTLFAYNIHKLNKMLSFMGLKIITKKYYHEFHICGNDDIPVIVNRMRARAQCVLRSASDLEYNYRTGGSQVRRLVASEREQYESQVK
jgi:hypothetical protein